MKIKILTSIALFVVSLVVLMGAIGSARADDWFVLGERSLKSADPSAEIKSEWGRWKRNIKKVRFSVEGADVEITRRVGDGRAYTFVVNHGDSPVEVVARGVDLVTGKAVDGRATVPSGAVRVIREEGAE